MKKTLLATACLSAVFSANAQNTNCTPHKLHISRFTSVLPSAQPDSLRIPSTHTFQVLTQNGVPYTDTSKGLVLGTFDFTGYVPINKSSTNGYVALNHEGGSPTSAGVSILDVSFDATKKLWNVAQKRKVDFAPIMGTARNCSGGVTPWMTAITSEESLPSGDANADGYQDIGWNVEIDPVTAKIKDYNNDGTPDKIWKMGRMSHENVCISNDSMVLYEANDEGAGYVFKYVLTNKADLSDGTLYVAKLDGAIGAATTGAWVMLPTSTPTECNNVRAAAAAAGATSFSSLEDVEIGPHDGKIYFTSKSSSRVYRFSDWGTTFGDVEVYVGNANQQYEIEYEGGKKVYEQWRGGNDNLTFDDLGNLYVLQDGGRNHIWMVGACHTPQNPDVKLFAVTPAGCEPTGMTFSPDYNYMFVSIQGPDGSNATVMKDAADSSIIFNKETCVVIARRGYLGKDTLEDTTTPNFIVDVNKVQDLTIEQTYPNPTTSDVTLKINSTLNQDADIRIYSMTGVLVYNQKATLKSGTSDINLSTAALATGTYNIVVTTPASKTNTRLVKQ
ncbi:MAG: putative phosphatase [Flavipsychrobacter sp.]|jgi:secreted PhoX family phosphatase|nr:putative phosphatase [Flavipsychrobacter sp.]